MARDFLAYWKPDTADHNVTIGGPLNHAASNQFSRVEPGDTVWLVTVRSGRLYLLGRIIVGQVTDQEGAARALHTTDLWEADYHIIAAHGTAHEITNLDIHSLAASLRFESKTGHDRLAVADNMVRAQQLQTMRILTPASAGLLSRALGSIAEPEAEVPQTYKEGAKKRIEVNVYERSPEARAICIQHYGLNCSVCGFNFEETYGEIGIGFIHVHHLKPLSEIGKDYKLNPITDLRPICPNCHAMIHQRSPAYTIDELRAILRKKRSA